jgi:hypothetical protein
MASPKVSKKWRHVPAEGIYGFGILANSSAMRVASSRCEDIA